MKKLFLFVVCLMMTMAANAQFEQGKYYCGASLSGLNLSYSGAEKTTFGVEAKGGYLFADNWMGLVNAGYKHEDSCDCFSAGVGARYYIIENGLFMGVNTKVMLSNGYNDIMPGIELGYAFFLGRSVTIEPSVYYDQSLKSHSDYSKVGLRIGLGVYL